jgi:hypothetical protein
MKVLRFDSVGGASGDMILGALIGLGADRAKLQKELDSLNVGEFEIQAKPLQSHGITGLQAGVHIHEHPHHHDHDERHHDHHDHRGLREISDIIQRSALPPAVKESSLRVFKRIADAEAKIHGTTPDKIHFHEIGAVDSIVDIVGCCLGLDLLGVQEVVVGPLPMGHGTIECAHGTYPSPAPATAELLKGAAVVDVDEPFELVTPTGAALLTTWRNLHAVPAGSRVLQTAHSFGHRELKGRPNLLRAILLEAVQTESAPNECLVLECNLDDTTPELIGALTERLLAAGALDVFTTAIQMKKQRPGALLSVLCESAHRDALLDLVFRESTTFGVREYMTQRTVLARRWEDVETPYGKVRVKIGRWRNDDVTSAPEMEDCIRLAREKNVPARMVYESAQQAARSRSTRAS